MDSSREVRKILVVTLDYQPSALEFVPGQREYFLVGTYSLDDADLAIKEAKGKSDADTREADDVNASEDEEKAPGQSRSGTVLLFRLDASKGELTKIKTHHTSSAVTDIRFSPHNPSVFAITCTDGAIEMNNISLIQNPTITSIFSSQIFDTLALSCAWNPSFRDLMAVTLTSGAVAILYWYENYTKFKILNENIIQHKSRFSDHEAWTSVFTPWNGNGGSAIYSGGDDSMLRGSILASDANIQEAMESNESDSQITDSSSDVVLKGHTAGVTAILPLSIHTALGHEILLTGSYDDHIRIITAHDSRQLSSEASDTFPAPPAILASLNLGGGVWRLKFMRDYQVSDDEGEERSYFVLASCMHAGARVLQITGKARGEWHISVLGAFTEHKSMNYASCVQPPEDADATSYVCVSSSFYDRLLAVWEIDVGT